MPSIPQYGVQRTTIPGVLNWYSDQNDAAFRIYAGRKENDAPYAVYNGKDKEEGYEALHKALAEMEPTDFSIYLLKIKPGNPKVKEGAAITFQLHTQQNQYGLPVANYQVNNEVLSRLSAIENKLEEPDEIEEDDEEPEENPTSIIAGILTQPQVRNALVSAILNMAGNMTRPQVQPVQNVAGIVEDDVQKSIEILFSKGVTPADLGLLAAMDKNQIAFLLSMLRK